MRDRRDLPDPEHTNIYAGAMYVEEMFDELVMNLNDQSYVHEGDRFITYRSNINGFLELFGRFQSW